MVSVEFLYPIESTVTIKALNLKGTVIALMQDSESTAYRVVYWADGKRNIEWMFSWELSA